MKISALTSCGQAFFLHDDRFMGRRSKGKGGKGKGGNAAMDDDNSRGKGKKLWDEVGDKVCAGMPPQVQLH